MAAVPWYLGDLAPTIPQPVLSPPAFGPIVRYNFNMRNALRAHMVLYDLAASGEIFGATEREFRSSFVDLGLDFEFNWWPYKTGSQKTKYSPYVTAGVGYSIDLFAEGKSHLYIPFGGGVKVNLGKRLSGGLEVSMRKTFTDILDGPDYVNPGREVGKMTLGNNDWYMFTGVFLTYKITNYLNECPTYPEKVYRLNSNSKRNKTDNWYEKPHDKESIFEKIGDLTKGKGRNKK